MVLSNFEYSSAVDITDITEHERNAGAVVNGNLNNNNRPAISVMSSNGYYGYCLVAEPPLAPTTAASVQHPVVSDQDYCYNNNYPRSGKRTTAATANAMEDVSSSSASKRYCHDNGNRSFHGSSVATGTALNGTTNSTTATNQMEMDVDMSTDAQMHFPEQSTNGVNNGLHLHTTLAMQPSNQGQYADSQQINSIINNSNRQLSALQPAATAASFQSSQAQFLSESSAQQMPASSRTIEVTVRCARYHYM